jgi:hypothetical protein
MDKRKLGKILLLIPFIMFGLSLLFGILHSNQYILTRYLGSWVTPVIEVLSTAGVYIAIAIFFTFPLLFGLGIFLIVKYRDKDKPLLPFKKVHSKIAKWCEKHDTFFSKKVNTKNIILGILIPLTLFILFFVFQIYLFSEMAEYFYDERSTSDIQELRIEKIKKDLKNLIPEKYELIESEYEAPSSENNGCVFLYEIYPKEYTYVEKEYLESASLIYCRDIYTAVLQDQTEDVKYDVKERKWLSGGSEPLEEKQYGENLVSITSLGGSQISYNYYIVEIDNSCELIILSIPSSNRIQCDFVEGVIEKENCESFMTSIEENDSPEWIPEKVYEDDYNDLLNILSNI